MILRRRGYAVFEAATIADALAWLADQPPHWMLLDLMLPDGCGIEILRKVRAARMTTRPALSPAAPPPCSMKPAKPAQRTRSSSPWMSSGW
jgi:CheY-like chemotaxis protein